MKPGHKHIHRKFSNAEICYCGAKMVWVDRFCTWLCETRLKKICEDLGYTIVKNKKTGEKA